MSSICADQLRPRIWAQMRGGGEGLRVSANEYSCAHHVTWSPNILWRYIPPYLTYDDIAPDPIIVSYFMRFKKGAVCRPAVRQALVRFPSRHLSGDHSTELASTVTLPEGASTTEIYVRYCRCQLKRNKLKRWLMQPHLKKIKNKK